MKTKTIFFIIALLLIAGIVFYFLNQDEAENQLFSKVKKGIFEVSVTNTGELRSKNNTDITAPGGLRNAHIWQIKITHLIPEGSMVKEGDIVAQLDKTEVMNKINEEQLNVQKNQSLYKQTQLDTTLTMREERDALRNLKYEVEEKKLAMEQSIYEPPAVRRQAEIDYEKAVKNSEEKKGNYRTKKAQSITKMKIVESDLAKSQAKLDILVEILNQLSIKAPRGGLLIYARDWDGRKRVVGGSVGAWDPKVAALPDLSEMESVTYINEVDIQKVKAGQKVLLGLDAQAGLELNGIVKTVANIGEQKPNSDAKVFEVVIDVTSKDTTLRPSMTTSNKIITKAITNALFIPIECIHSTGPINFVYKKGSRPVKQEVKTGLFNEREAVILEGLKEGEEVYVSIPSDTTGLSLISLTK